MKIKNIFDNEGKTFDRFTVTFADRSALGLSINPDSPQGFSQWCDAVEGHHLGKIITFKDLPESVKKHVLERIKEV